MIARLESPPSRSGTSVPDDPAMAAMRAWRDQGDQSAARELVEQLSPLVRGIVCHRLPRVWMVEDAVQDTLTRVFCSLDRFDARVPLSAWTVCLAKNVCSNILRSWRRRHVLPLAETGLENLHGIERGEHLPSLDEAVMAREELRFILARIASMDEGDRLLMKLTFMGGCSELDAAHQNRISIGALRVRTSRIRAALRESLRFEQS